MNCKEIADKLKKYLTDNNFKEFFEKFDEVVSHVSISTDLSNEALLLDARLNRIIRSKQEGIIDPDFVEIEFNKITKSCLTLIEKLENACKNEFISFSIPDIIGNNKLTNHSFFKTVYKDIHFGIHDSIIKVSNDEFAHKISDFLKFKYNVYSKEFFHLAKDEQVIINTENLWELILNAIKESQSKYESYIQENDLDSFFQELKDEGHEEVIVTGVEWLQKIFDSSFFGNNRERFISTLNLLGFGLELTLSQALRILKRKKATNKE